MNTTTMALLALTALALAVAPGATAECVPTDVGTACATVTGDQSSGSASVTFEGSGISHATNADYSTGL